MAYEFKLPDVGEGVHEGEIVQWLVREGDAVEEDQDIVEVMTDKATVQLSSPVKGTIETIHFQEGEVVNVGDVFVTIAFGDGAESAAAGAGGEAAADSRQDEGPASSEQATPRHTTPARAADGPGRATAGESPSDLRALGPEGVAPRGRTPSGILAPPSVRLEARRRDIDLTTVKGSARGGRITMADLEGSARPRTAPARPARGPLEGAPINAYEVPSVDRTHAVRTEPMRAAASSPKAAAARAKALQAHFSYVLDVDADGLARAVERSQPAAKEAGVPIDASAFVVKALAVALSKHPRCNALVDEGSGDLIVPERINVGVAVPTDDGLAVRVVADAHRRGVLDIARVLAEGPGDHATPSVTLTAMGRLGGVVSTPVLVQPQVTGITVGAMRDVARERNGSFVPGKAMTLSCSFDHRYIDGHDGAVMANECARLLTSAGALLSEDPA